MSHDTDAPAREPTPEAGAPGGATFSRILAVLVVALVAVDVVLLSAFGSHFGQALHDQRLAAGLVLTASITLAVVLPVAAMTVGLRRLASRGVKVRRSRLLAAGLLGWNALGIGLIAWGNPGGPVPLLSERGTWVVDGLRGVGPFGPAALPTARRLLADARGTAHLRDAAPLLSDASAAGEAAQLLLLLDASRDLREGGDPVNQQLDRLLGRHDLDPQLLRTAPEEVTVEHGRALLADVLDIVPVEGGAAGGADRTWAWPAPIPEDVQLEPVSRAVLALSAPAGWELRWEDGAWRLHTGELPEYAARAREHLAAVRFVAPGAGAAHGRGTPSTGARVDAAGTHDGASREDAAPPLDVAAPGGGDAGPAAAAIRGALTAAARGRFGVQAETTAFAAAWPDALTREAAAQQGERVRAWCVAAAGDDPLFAADHRQLFTDWRMGEPTDAVTNAQLEQLTRRGRQWLADVLAICAPVVAARQQADADLGNAVVDARRMRWAERDAAELAESAVVTLGAEEGSATIALPGGVVREAVLQDGAWRVHWPD